MEAIYAYIHHLCQDLESSLGLRKNQCGVLSDIHKNCPKPNNKPKNLEDRRFYVNLAMGLFCRPIIENQLIRQERTAGLCVTHFINQRTQSNPALVQEFVQDTTKGAIYYSHMARCAILTFGSHFSSWYTPHSESAFHLTFDKTIKALELMEMYLEKESQQFLWPSEMEIYVNSLLKYASFLSKGSISNNQSLLENMREAISLTHRLLDNVPRVLRDPILLAQAQFAYNASLKYPGHFEFTPAHRQEWLAALERLLLSPPSNQPEEIDLRVRMLSVLYWAFLEDPIKVSEVFSRRPTYWGTDNLLQLKLKCLRSLAVQAAQSPVSKDYWENTERILLISEFLEEGGAYEKAPLILLSGMSPEASEEEFLSHLLRRIIHTKDPHYFAGSLYLYGQLIYQGRIQTDLQGQPISPDSIAQTAAAFFMHSGTFEARAYLYEMLMHGLLGMDDLPQEGPLSEAFLINEFKSASPYHKILFLMRNAQNDPSSAMSNLAKSITLLETSNFPADSELVKYVNHLQTDLTFRLGDLTRRTCVAHERESDPAIPKAAHVHEVRLSHPSEELELPFGVRCFPKKEKAKPKHLWLSSRQLALEDAKRLRVKNLIGYSEPPAYLKSLDVEVGDLVEEEYKRHGYSNKRAIMDILDDIKKGVSLKGMETLKAYKGIQGIPFELLKNGKIRAVPIEGNHRLVYKQIGPEITVYRCFGHYDDQIAGLNH